MKMSVFMLCERAVGLVRGNRLDLSSSEKAMLEALNYDGLTAANVQDEAVSCARHFVSVRDWLFNTYPWVFARRNAALGLSAGSMAGWRFVYALPGDCVKLHELVQPHGTTPKYEQAGNVVGCDAKNVSAKYTAIVTDAAQWPEPFQGAFRYRLAHEIALSVSGEPAMRAEALNSFESTISECYRTRIIDPGTKTDNNMNNATQNTTRLFNPTPEAPSGDANRRK
jgi:hypothetical protein